MSVLKETIERLKYDEPDPYRQERLKTLEKILFGPGP
jgi:hypothetical protein